MGRRTKTLDVSYSIPEEMATGSVVGNIVQDLGLDVKRLTSGKARVYTGGSAEYISLDKERGVLVIKEKIDRELLCGETTPCALQFQIIIESPMELFRVLVEITDINDNVPSFTNNVKRFEISESAIVGSKFVLEKAIDLDIGLNGLQSYSLNPSDHFALKLENQPDGSKKVEMVLQKPLDRELNEQLSLLLTAMDGGEPQMSGTMQIFITVLDVNDNSPVFTKPIYNAKIMENSPKGTRLTTVSATDKDKGSNGDVSYIISNSKHRLTELFQVDKKSGEIILIGDIDYEKAKHYQIDIEAVDNGGLSDSSKVMVNVVDVNDNTPYPNIVSKLESTHEDSPPNTVIAMLSITDPDSDNNGEVECTLLDKIGQPFKIDSTMNGFYSVVTEATLDREVSAQYNITVTCSDRGVPSLTSSITLSLKIADINDNAPVFESSSYEAFVVENNAAGISVFTINARDADWKQNARVSYILEDSSINGVPIYRWRQSRILYHSNLPVIPYYPPRYSDTLGTGTLQHVYNYEVCRTTDSRKSDCKFGNAGSQNVLIMDPSSTGTMQRMQSEKSILDEPDSPLEITYSIPEEMSKGSLVGNIARDLGLDLKRLMTGRARLHFGNAAEYIALDKERGVLLVKERIDRETVCRQTTPCALHFQIILENPIEFYRVTVEIKDVNDNAPVFKTDRMLFEISESAVKGAKFILESASDSDVGENGLKSYSLNPTDHFILKLHDHADGRKEVEMVLQKPLDRENQEQFNMVLTAIDGGEPHLSGTARIEITVLDANDNAPTFSQAVYTASLVENSPKGALVTIVSASDRDHGSNGLVAYSISSSTDHILDVFKIDENTGQIHLSGALDYETSKHYQIDIKAKDLGGLYDSCKVMLDVTDVNDNSPVIDLISTTPLISEDAALQTVVAVMSVRDADSEDNGEVTCALNDNIEFSIKTDSSGFYSLVTDSVLDRERAAEYNVTVTCSDRGAPSLSSRVTLRLQVSDVNDNAPIFERESYEALIVENNTPGVSIYTIKASDDWKQNARVSYILEDSSINGVPIYRWRQSRILYHSNLPVIPYYPPRYSDTLGTGTLQHVYNYEVCRTTDSRKSDCKFGNAGSQNVLIMDPSSTGTMQRIQSEKSILDEPDSPLE
ncbi:hypothetical protein CRUP_007500, partial [Coryphaenoides rupestris]